ncbi:MAG: hypothetical protein UU34_C0002G0007 [Candidatus Curtissbacteria bacterium GW2011_GWA1_41_11]|uniref:CBU-0592-like domain-containing protein n=1 Tax=Candidatus Curtissbacteria bacterium GW2011_GWA1_41_11 TaxID=1618409 RepID=A0A0G0WTW6_9BACT|nr:MAG: hypothetical protein UU34_C0002G0007 [Candidatus Curtissbacteria bacterium GW2011_GWA1_41_11]
MDFNFAIGVIGLFLLLISFILNSIKKLNQESFNYNLINLGGAGFLIYYAFTIDSLPFLILESVWAVFAGYKVMNIFFTKGIK